MIDVEVLKDRHAEELKDVDVYKNLADKYPQFRQIFCDIAKDEASHAEFLKYIIERFD